MMMTISFGFTFVFMYSEVTFLGENSSTGSTSVSFIFLFCQGCRHQVLRLWRSESMIVSEVRRIMSLSLAPAPVSDRSSRSPPTRELIALSVLLFTQQAHTVNKESIICRYSSLLPLLNLKISLVGYFSIISPSRFFGKMVVV